MSWNVDVDHGRRRVVSRWLDVADESQLFDYVDTVWTDPAVRGYDELIDFRAVTDVQVSSAAIEALAQYSRTYDNPEQTARSAIVAAQALVFGLSRMFSTLRALEEHDRREWRVFDDLARATDWLDA